MFKKYLPIKTIILTASFWMVAEANFASIPNPKETSNLLPKSTLIAQSTTHRVRLGDSLWGISNKYGISIGQLINLNPKLRSRPNLIYVGELLYVRGVARTPTKTQTTATNHRTQSNRRRTSTFNLPKDRRVLKTRIGANRGGSDCLANPSDRLRTLLPDNNFGLTLYDYPQFFWYSPELETKSLAEVEIYFTLGEVERSEENGQIREKIAEEPLYEAELTSIKRNRAEIVSFTLPPDSDPLEEGKEYEWEVVIECPSGSSISAQGRIKRLSTENPELSSQLESAAIADYPAILAESGVWYDALQIMTGLMREDPEDEILQQDWQNVLELIELETASQIPIQYVEPIFDEQIGQN